MKKQRSFQVYCFQIQSQEVWCLPKSSYTIGLFSDWDRHSGKKEKQAHLEDSPRYEPCLMQTTLSHFRGNCNQDDKTPRQTNSDSSNNKHTKCQAQVFLLVSCSWGQPLDSSHHFFFKASRKWFSCRCSIASVKSLVCGSFSCKASANPLAVVSPGTEPKMITRTW